MFAENPSLAKRMRWGLMAAGALAMLGIATVWMAGLKADSDLGPRLLHTVSRGNLIVTITEQGTLESSENTEIKCKVRGQNTVIWVIDGGTYVQPGDDLVRLDTLFIEEQINERSKYAHWSRSASERSKADVARAELAVKEYLDGRYVSQVATLEKDLAIAESNLRTARNMLIHVKLMSERGYISELEVEEKEFAVTQAELDVDLKKTEIDVLEKYTKEIELQTLQGNFAADSARHEADKERAYADALRRDRAVEELAQCVIKADRSGLVIYPSAAAWKNSPDIEPGATVHQDQVLLLMPDMSQMQVKVGVHESMIDRVQPGLRARVKLPDRTLDAEVTTVAEVTSPAGWWTGNVVKYDTTVKLPSVQGLKPGMSSQVELILAEHRDVLTIPVSAVIETDEGTFCWVSTPQGPQRREVDLGDTNDVFIIVHEGVQPGDRVFLNPMAFVDEAQTQAIKLRKNSAPDETTSESPASSAGEIEANDMPPLEKDS